MEASIETLTPAKQQTLLGLMYAQGHCRPQDRQRALSHLRKGAQLGDADAMYAFFVTAGEASEATNDSGYQKHVRDWDEGVRWLQEAAKSGNWRAALVLGDVCYKFGACELPRNLKLSHYWCQRYNELAPPEVIPKNFDCNADHSTAKEHHK